MAAVSCAEARTAYAEALKRCPACHGQVMILGTYGARASYRLTHRRNHGGCPLVPDTFRGGAQPHPEALA